MSVASKPVVSRVALCLWVVTLSLMALIIEDLAIAFGIVWLLGMAQSWKCLDAPTFQEMKEPFHQFLLFLIWFLTIYGIIHRRYVERLAFIDFSRSPLVSTFSLLTASQAFVRSLLDPKRSPLKSILGARGSFPILLNQRNSPPILHNPKRSLRNRCC